MPQVVLLTGPSGSGKSHLAAESGLPVLELDNFYRDGDDPRLPRHPTLGIVDWDDPRSWDAESALTAVALVCRTGSAEVPVYDIAHDGRVGTTRFEVGDADVFVGTGIFAAELIAACRDHALLADAVVVRNETRFHAGSKDSSGRQQPGSDMYHAVVEYKAEDGKTRTVEMAAGHWPQRYETGQAVRVRYDPSEPLRARISDGGFGDTLERQAVTIITGFLAFVFTTVGLVVRRLLPA